MDISGLTLQAPRVSRIVGIDLGTTHSAIAVVEAGIPGLLADPEGNRLVPSVVHYPEDGPPTVGRAAQRVRVLEPARTIYSIKRFMGRRTADSPVNYSISGEPLTVDLGGRRVAPEEVSADILRALKQQAEEALEEAVDRAVITVPAYFNDAQRQATRKAGELAGLTVERIVNEPTAAALACGLEKLPEQSRVAVYDLGGGTFDVSILELREGIFQVLATSGNTQLGGDDVDARVVGWLGRQIEPNLDAVQQARLRGLQN